MVDAENTRAAFLGLIDKPPLTDQLLARPPFKFILDIVKSTVSKTGYLKDRFSPDDLNPLKFNDKTSKVAFLDDLLETLNDGSLDNVKSSKIVAGKEPELTNLMLTKLAEQARAHSQNSQSKKASKHSRSPHHQENSPTPLKAKHRLKRKNSKGEKSKNLSTNEHAGEEKTEEKKKRSKSKDHGSHEKSSRRKGDEEKEKEKPSSSPEKRKKGNEEKNRDINSNVVKLQNDQEVDLQNSFQLGSLKDSGETQPLSVTGDSAVNEISTGQRPTTHERYHIVRTYNDQSLNYRLSSALVRPQTSLGRPGTAAARPPPPRLKRKQIAAVDETNMTPTQQTLKLISEAASTAPSETFLVEDAEDVEEPTQDNFRRSEVPGAISEQGGLVRKIIDTTAEFELSLSNDDVEIDQGVYANEKIKLESLLNALQEVTRIANPLSRIFDFAQEDLELMIKELEKWRNETKKYKTFLEDKETQGIGEVHKLSKILNRLDEEVKDVRLSVTSAKARILANNERIHEMLGNI